MNPHQNRLLSFICHKALYPNLKKEYQNQTPSEQHTPLGQLPFSKNHMPNLSKVDAGPFSGNGKEIRQKKTSWAAGDRYIPQRDTDHQRTNSMMQFIFKKNSIFLLFAHFMQILFFARFSDRILSNEL